MLRKYICILILPIILLSCGISNRKEAEKIIIEFKENKVPDKREVIFHVSAGFRKGTVILEGETDNPQLKKELTEHLKSIQIINNIVVLPDSTVGKNTFGFVNTSVANFRSNPTHSAELATQALLGTPVKILKVQRGWYLVQTPDNYISWVDEAGVVPVSSDQSRMWKSSKRVIFTEDNGLLFEDKNFNIPVSDITLGSILEEVERKRNSLEVKFPDGRIGFSRPEYWMDFSEFKNNINPDTTSLKELSQQFIGRPYLWGGTSAKAMDCSGFVKTLFFMNGIILARDASLQTRHGRIIDTDAGFNHLQTGDLLFFGKKGSPEQKEKVTHVALSLGQMEYVHSAGRVKRNSLNPESEVYSENRRNSLVRARRIIGIEGNDGIQYIKNHPWY